MPMKALKLIKTYQNRYIWHDNESIKTYDASPGLEGRVTQRQKFQE